MKKGSEKQIKEAEELALEIEELTNCWKRALADYQNLEKRIENEKKDFIQFSNRELIQKLLPVLDHFERADEHLKDQGLQMAIRDFKRVLSEEGLEEIGVLGQEYNPVEMEAVEVVEGKESGKVVEVAQKGYRLKDKVIRPARVKVTKVNEQK
jgi:molecular chaperone GrpE